MTDKQKLEIILGVIFFGGTTFAIGLDSIVIFGLTCLASYLFYRWAFH